MPPMAAASALPIAVFVFLTWIVFSCFLWAGRWTRPSAGAFFPAVFSAAAFFCASFTSSMVSPSLSSSFNAAS